MNILFSIIFITIAYCITSLYRENRGGYPAFFDKNYTTTAKGIAILMIMLGHCACFWPHGRLLSPLGGTGVSIFLITSGYGLNESYKRHGLKDFWKKRFARVYVPYCIAILVIGICRQWDMTDWILYFLCIKCNYWFISYIICCYIVFWICTKFCTKYRIGIMLILSLISLLCLPNLQAEQSLGLITGILISVYQKRMIDLISNRKKVAGIIVCSFAVGLIFLAIKQLPVVRNEATMIEMHIIQLLIKYPLSLGILIGLLFAKPLLKNHFLYLAGLISYELYIVHSPFFSYIGERLWPAILLFVFSFIGAYIFYRLNNFIHKQIMG